MIGPNVLIIITCILTAAVSNKWEIKMPQYIDAISGFCVQIPCTFEIPDSFTKYLNKSVEAVWKKTDPSFGPNVFSSRSQVSPLKGEVTGSLLSKNCTTVFQNFPAGSNGTYFFRLQGPEPLIYSFQQGVNIKVQEELLAPVLSPDVEVLEVPEGTNVTLMCASVLPCPSQQPLMNWSLILGKLRTPTIQVNEFGQTLLVSSQMFNVGPLIDRLKVSCFLLYTSQRNRRPVETSITIRVLYAPRSTIALASPSGPVSEGSVVTLSCQSDANPAVQRYEWYRQSGDGLVLKAQGQVVTMTVSSNVLGLYVCKAHNIHGTHQSRAVAIELKSCQCSITPYIMCGVLTCFVILITAVDLVKYKNLLKRLKRAEDMKEPLTYTSLHRTNDMSTYNEIQTTANRTEEDYENRNWVKH